VFRDVHGWQQVLTILWLTPRPTNFSTSSTFSIDSGKFLSVGGQRVGVSDGILYPLPASTVQFTLRPDGIVASADGTNALYGEFWWYVGHG
jgi:hypothetical protein